VKNLNYTLNVNSKQAETVSQAKGLTFFETVYF